MNTERLNELQVQLEQAKQQHLQALQMVGRAEGNIQALNGAIQETLWSIECLKAAEAASRNVQERK